MRKLFLMAALAAGMLAHAQYSNQATQRWTYMRLAELEARLRAEIGGITASTNYASAQEFTNAVSGVATLSVSQMAATLTDMYNSGFAAAASGNVSTQYVCYGATPAAIAVPGLTNAVPIGARFLYQGIDGMGQPTYQTQSGDARLVFYLSDGVESMGTLLAYPGTAREMGFTQSMDYLSVFTMDYPVGNTGAVLTVIKTLIPR